MAETFPTGTFHTITGKGLRGTELKIAAGDWVRFRRPDGVIARDQVRTCFYAYILVAPYAPNYSEPAVVLTNHSWTPLSHILSVEGT